MTASAAPRMSSKRSRACGRSILATSPTAPPPQAFATARARRRSAPLCTKLTPTKSTPIAAAASISATSASVTAESGSATPGALIPFRAVSRPPNSTSVSISTPSLSTTRSAMAPSSSSSDSPPRTAAASGAHEVDTRSASPANSPTAIRRRAPVSRVTPAGSASGPMRTLGPARSCSTATMRPARSARARIRSTIARRSSRLPCEALVRKTSTPAASSASMPASVQDAGPRVATILVWRTGGLAPGSRPPTEPAGSRRPRASFYAQGRRSAGAVRPARRPCAIRPSVLPRRGSARSVIPARVRPSATRESFRCLAAERPGPAPARLAERVTRVPFRRVVRARSGPARGPGAVPSRRCRGSAAGAHLGRRWTPGRGVPMMSSFFTAF